MNKSFHLVLALGFAIASTLALAAPAEMAMLTRGKFGVRNPHFSPHWLDTPPCEECHKQHKPPVNYCTDACHTFPEMVVK